MRKRRYNARGITRKQFYILTGMLAVAFGLFLYGVHKENQLPEDSGVYKPVAEVTGAGYISGMPCERVTEALQATPTEEVQQDILSYSDPNNYVYPFNTMSADWGSELYESGFRYYQIPDEYVEAGGCFPEVVQAYLWSICKDRGIDYYIMVALIESESHYKYNAKGDNGNSLGYMQIYQKWHEDRMQEEGADDLINPYQNIRVGTNFFSEIQGRYLESSGIQCVLMVYNMGEAGAKKCWSEGIYSTKYSRAIVERAQEIEQELTQE